MGPGENSGNHMMPSGSPGMGPGMGSQFMGQQSYGDAVSKGYGQPVMYGRPGAAYNPASAYGGRYACVFCLVTSVTLFLSQTKWLDCAEDDFAHTCVNYGKPA